MKKIAYSFLSLILLLALGCNPSGDGAKNQSAPVADTPSNGKNQVRVVEYYLDTLSQEAKQAKLEELKLRFKHNVDEFQEVSFYHHKIWGNVVQKKKTLVAYVNSKGTPFLVTNYYSDDWIFHTFIEVLVGGTKYQTEAKPSYNDDVLRDNSGGKVWERITYPRSEIIKAIAENPTADVKIKFTGGDCYDTATLTAKEKQAMKDCYELAYLLKK